MNTVTIYGSSDDVIALDGAIREEIDVSGDADGRHYLAFSDGSIISIIYTDEGDGIWRVTPVRIADGATFTNTQAPLDDETVYSDVATLTSDGPFHAVVCGKHLISRLT